MFPAEPITWCWAKWSQDKTKVHFFFHVIVEVGHTWFELACIIAASCAVHLWLRYCFCFQGYSIFHQEKHFP